MATTLRGRSITYEIFPLSFSEYLSFKGIEVNLYSTQSLAYIKNALNSYLVDGGFIETIDKKKIIIVPLYKWLLGSMLLKEKVIL